MQSIGVGRMSPGVDRTQLSGDLYAKVIKQVDESAHRFAIRFTSVPPEIAIALQALRQTN
ncbi:hypothetical protein [Leptodesmis sp.]|uniref:hypothetical protein n=1 Tax=Leptodesmis sp. TaxID=3100501 RepID=UPI0040535808